MKTEEQLRVEFREWYLDASETFGFNFAKLVRDVAEQAWRARQPEIDAKDIEIARLREALLEIAGMDVDFRATIIATKALNGENHE